MIKGLFWNSEQRRLQALWRMGITLAVSFLLMIPPSIALGFIALARLTAGGQMTTAQAAGQIFQLLLGDPALRTATMLITLVVVAIGAWIGSRFIDRRRVADLGFHFSRRWWASFGFGLALGALLMALIFGVERAAGWVTITGSFTTFGPRGVFPVDFLVPLIGFVGVGIYEELLFRGYLMKNLAEGPRSPNPNPTRSLIIAWLIGAAIFGLAHASNPNASWISTLNIALAGLLLGLPYILTGELAISIGFHISWNLFQGNVFGFPVSGQPFAPPSVIAIRQGGPDVWTGGAFGPEAGLIGVAAILLGAGLTLAWLRWRDTPLSLSGALANFTHRNQTAPAGTLPAPSKAA